MFYLQIFLPAGLVLLLFSFGHTLVEADYSGVYFEEPLEELAEGSQRQRDVVVLRYFGPEVHPDAPAIGAYRKNKF